MCRRLWFAIAAVVLLAAVAAPCLAVGKYSLAFWRETGFNEKGGIGGNHVINVHVWDQYGNPLAGKHVYAGTLDMGATDSNGQIELAVYEPNAYVLSINDGSNLSDATPGFSTTRAPDWGHYCFECGFMYFSDSASTANFDTNYDGKLNSSSSNYVCNNPEMSAPCTRSMAFYCTKPDLGYYCSDVWEGSSAVTTCGQTFKANGNRVVAAKFNATGGNAQYILKIREGGPTGAYVGSAATSPTVGTYEYAKTMTKWGINSVQVIPGNTYFLEIAKSGGGTFNVNRIVNDNYPYGNYYEGATAFSTRELRGEIICATYGTVAESGAVTGSVKNSSGTGLSGATVSTNTGGYTATTDASGNYTLASVAAGNYSLTASRSGYASGTNTGVVVTSRQTTTSNFTLTSNAGAISGNVKDSGSNNISGASVSTNTGGYSAITDASGNYTMSVVTAGTYDVTASKSGFAAITQSGKTVTANNTTSVNFTLNTAPVLVELLTNGRFTNGCTGWSHSQSPSGIYWGCGNKVYTAGSGSGGHSWNAFLACGGTGFCDKAFTGSQYQDNVTVTGGSPYTASAQVFYEPVAHAGDASDQKERIVLTFNDSLATVQTSAWQTHTNPIGWNQVSFAGNVPSGATKMQFKVELSHTDSQWSGTGAVDECSFMSSVCTSPSITTHPVSQTKNVGQSVTFSVTASGTATLSYQWKKNTNNISGATSSSYTISSLSAGDAGSYTCTVTNSCGAPTSNAATLVVVTPVATISAAKAYGDGTVVSVANKAVTASTGSAFWIEESDRSSGIKAVASNSLAAGANVTVVGTLATINAERMLSSATFTTSGTLAVPGSLGLGNAAFGGVPLVGSNGPSNVGLLVRVWGRVTKTYPDKFFINDGTMRSDFSGETGIRVMSGALSEPALNQYVMVTGVVSTESSGGNNVPILIPRTQADIRVF